MSDPHAADSQPAPLSADENLSALFANLVVQQGNMAMMLLGKVAHPETGQTVKDLEAARLFIDQLEMLEVKTKGNLTKDEAALLKQSLMGLRLAFVEAVESPETPAATETKGPAQPAPKEESPTIQPAPGASATAPEEPHKKFTKKY
jgi:hypothetical protein